MVGRKRSDPKTEFGREMSGMIESKSASMSAVTRDMGFSQSYSYNVLRGDKPATPQYVNALATALGATDDERNRLNLAAARDVGFELRLPEDW